MKSAVVMEISGKNAVVLLSDGCFETVKTKPEWEVGAVVSVDVKKKTTAPIYIKIIAAAAVFAVLTLSSLVLGQILNTATSLISMDINPSVEIEINRLGIVVSSFAYNEDGEELLSSLQIKGVKYQDAVELILSSDELKPYLASRNYIDFAVFSENRQQELLDYLEKTAENLLSDYPDLALSCNGVNRDVVGNARRHHISPGKMRAIMELVEISPEIEEEDYYGCDINRINRDIENCRRANGEGGGNANGNGSGGGSGGNANDGGWGQGSTSPAEQNPERSGSHHVHSRQRQQSNQGSQGIETKSSSDIEGSSLGAKQGEEKSPLQSRAGENKEQEPKEDGSGQEAGENDALAQEGQQERKGK